jgi:hypothetical protein
MKDPLMERAAPRARAPPLRIAARAVMASTMPCQPSSCGAPWRALGAARAPPKSRFSAACPYSLQPCMKDPPSARLARWHAVK